MGTYDIDASVEVELVLAGEESTDPGSGLLIRGLGGVVAACGATICILYLFVPVGNSAGSDLPALIDLNSTYTDIGTIFHSVLVALVGLAVIVRPALGVGGLVAAAVPVPWLISLSRGNFLASEITAPLQALRIVGVVLGGALAVALVMAGLRRRPAETGMLVADMVALLAGLVGLWATLSFHWFRIPEVQTPDRAGGILNTETLAGRGAWAGLILAAAGLVLAVRDPGVGRRLVGGMLVVVLVVEALMRTLLSSKAIIGPRGGQIVSRTAVPIVGYVVFQVVGAAAGAWLATTSGGRRRRQG